MKTKKKSVALRVRNLFLTLFAACVLAVGGVALRGYCLYTAALEGLPLQAAARQVREQAGFTPISQLPQTYLTAVVSAEDHRFYEHNGIDLIAIGRALYNDLRTLSLAEGGSTITQQLAKNLYFTQEKEFTRKAAEVFMAWKLEHDFSKEEILELYVNSIYFGSGCYTVGDASRAYFGKAPADMDDGECTLLAGIPNAPGVYDLNVNPGLARQRQRQVVELMVEYGGFTRSRADRILDSAGQAADPQRLCAVLCRPVAESVLV